MKRAMLVALGALLLGNHVKADTTPTQTWNITATCDPNAMFPPAFICNDPFSLSAVFTTQFETGTFHEYAFNTDVSSANVVIAISGTFNGLAMTLVPNAPGDWLNGPDVPEEIFFLAGGLEYSLYPDFAAAWLNSGGPTEPLIWSAVQSVPEPSAVFLLGIGLATLLWRFCRPSM